MPAVHAGAARRIAGAPIRTFKADAQHRRPQQGRAAWPTSFPDLKFPQLQRATLQQRHRRSILAERHDDAGRADELQFDGGYARDLGRKLGTASFAMGMLDEGARRPRRARVRATAPKRSARTSAPAPGSTAASVDLSALKEKLDAVAGAVRRHAAQPAFRRRPRSSASARQWLAGIAQEKAQPHGARAARAAAAAVRRRPSVRDPVQRHRHRSRRSPALTRDDLRRLPRRLAASGQRDARRRRRHHARARSCRMLEKRFGDWKAPARAPAHADVADGRRADRSRACS